MQGLSIGVVVAVLCLVVGPAALACTGITVKAEDGTVISSRSLEFGFDLHSNIMFVPRDYAMQSPLPDGKVGVTWSQKYATLGLNGLGRAFFAEGFNEKGLSAGAFYLPGFAEYSKLTPENASKAMLSAYVVSWILGNFATVDEVKAGLDRAVVVEGMLPGVDLPLPLHWRVTDASGKCIVIEYVNGGQVKAYDNPLGVITNSPTWDWHVTNLRNYINLTPVDASPVTVDGIVLAENGQGSGMVGLPGDYTPPSRLVRIFAIQHSALPVKTAEDGVTLAWNIIDNVNIPKGASRGEAAGGKFHYDYTQWVNASDLRNLKLYFRNYDNPQIRTVSMREMPLDGKDILLIPLATPPQYPDVSSGAKKAEFK